jgi:hypothetical protein
MFRNFSVKNKMTDFCLVVEGCEFWVPRGYLGTISPFFRKLCYETAGKEGRAVLEKKIWRIFSISHSIVLKLKVILNKHQK